MNYTILYPYFCKICDNIMNNIHPQKKMRQFFCDTCEFDGWRRCINCWKMVIADNKPYNIIRGLHCLCKPNTLSLMKL